MLSFKKFRFQSVEVNLKAQFLRRHFVGDLVVKVMLGLYVLAVGAYLWDGQANKALYFTGAALALHEWRQRKFSRT